MDKEFIKNAMDVKGQYTYYAFISYQRKDEKWAKWLQRKLENYKLPVANAKDAADKKSKYIRPVFRDKTDLTAGPLPDALKEALRQSRYLIVICSPNAVESPWVNEEVETFTKAGRTESVIPFIVDGEPYSKKGVNECFPDAIKDIPKDKEPLGVNIHENGKERAFIRTVAYMLNVKFDELWNRFERHRRKMRNITIACLTFLALIALGIYDYTRTKVEYYADWVDCNGVAQGVIPLSDEQYSHRCASYKFEYTRVPFGEKSFYSWRLNKVSLVNSKGVVSNYTPDNHVFFYPIQEYKYTDGYVTEIINRDTYNRVVMRYTIKDDYDHKVACLVDMEGKEKHQGSAYLSGSTTAFLSDANPNMSKIKRFHYTRNEKGYITKVTYHANDADELDESAIGDNNNIYGKLFDLDEFGRVTKVTYINHEGNPMTDKYGVGYIRYSNAGFEENDTTEYLGSDGKLAYNEHRFARQINILDKYGNPIESCNEGTDGKPCYDYKNIFRQVVTFDENGCFTEIKYYDFDGNLSYCSDNYAIQRVKYDSKGRWVEVVHYDVNDKPCYTKNNYSITRARYDAKDRIIEQSFYDINGKPCVEKVYGTFCIKTNYDEYNYIVEQSVWGSDNKPSISPSYGFHLQKNEYDDYHRLIKCISYDTKGNRCINTQEYCCEGRYTYDTRGNLVKIECLDTEGKPCFCKDGYATITYKNDNYGNRIEERYYGIKGEPIYIKGCAMIQYNYHLNGLLSEDRYYNDKDSLCLNLEWFAISRYEYDINGNQIKHCFYDVDTTLCTTKEWFYSVLERKIKNGDIVEERFYNKEQKLEENGYGYAIGKYSYDDKHRLISLRYFNKDSLPCVNNSYIHFDSIVYDNRGLKVKEMYFDKNGRRCKANNGSSQLTYVYDKKGNQIREVCFGSNGEKCMNNHGYCSWGKKYDVYGRVIDICYFNIHDKPVMAELKEGNGGIRSICQELYKYDNKGNVIEKAFLNNNGKPTVKNGWARETHLYDALNRVSESRFYDEENKLIGGKNGKPIERYVYNNVGQTELIQLLEKDETLYTNIYMKYDKNNLSEIRLTDRDFKLHVLSVLQINYGQPYAMARYTYDERGLHKKSAFYDEKEQLYNGKMGYAYLLNYRDERGRIIRQELYDKNGKPAESIVGKWSVAVNGYDKRGNLIEQSYYDKNNHMAHTPYGWARRLQTYNDRGQCIKDVYHYFADGKWQVEVYDPLKRQEDNTEKGEAINEGTFILIALKVENYGQMYEKGFEGSYFVLELNDWTMYDGMDSFVEEMMRGKDKPKRLVLQPWNKKGEVIEFTFSTDPLSARLMDWQQSDGGNKTYKEISSYYEKWKSNK